MLSYRENRLGQLAFYDISCPYHSVSFKMEAPDLSRVSGQGHDGPRTIGLDVPYTDCFIVRAADDAARVELDAADATRVTLKCANVAATPKPATPQLETLAEHRLPAHHAVDTRFTLSPQTRQLLGAL